jgi:hypothetical protein
VEHVFERLQRVRTWRPDGLFLSREIREWLEARTDLSLPEVLERPLPAVDFRRERPAATPSAPSSISVHIVRVTALTCRSASICETKEALLATWLDYQPVEPSSLGLRINGDNPR